MSVSLHTGPVWTKGNPQFCVYPFLVKDARLFLSIHTIFFCKSSSRLPIYKKMRKDAKFILSYKVKIFIDFYM